MAGLYAWQPSATIAGMSEAVQRSDEIVDATQQTAELTTQSIARTGKGDRVNYSISLGAAVWTTEGQFTAVTFS